MTTIAATLNTMGTIATHLMPRCDGIKTYFRDYALFDRVNADWRVLMMDCSIVIAVSCMVLNYFKSALFLCYVFAYLSISSLVSAYNMREFVTLRGYDAVLKRLEEDYEKSQANNKTLTENLTLATGQLAVVTDGATKIVTQLESQTGQVGSAVKEVKTTLESSRELASNLHTLLTNQDRMLADRMVDLLAAIQSSKAIEDKVKELSNLQNQQLLLTQRLYELREKTSYEHGQLKTLKDNIIQANEEHNRIMACNLSAMQENTNQMRNLIYQGAQMIEGRPTPNSLEPLPPPNRIGYTSVTIEEIK